MLPAMSVCDYLVQVFNKLLTLASGAGQSLEYLLWQSMFVSTSGVRDG